MLKTNTINDEESKTSKCPDVREPRTVCEKSAASNEESVWQMQENCPAQTTIHGLTTIGPNTKKKPDDYPSPNVNRWLELPDNGNVEREYVARNSVLTDLLRDTNARTVYHCFLTIFILLAMTTVTHDYVDSGRINLGLDPIFIGFGKLYIGLPLWGCMQIVVFFVYPCFRLWVVRRREMKPGCVRILWDALFVCIYFVYQLAFFVLAIGAQLWTGLAMATSIAYLLEMTRFMMKTHSFVRGNLYRAVTSNNENGSNPVPPFDAFRYFMFAPTLVYRDAYPRTDRIRWHLVAVHLLQMVAMVFYLSFVVERFHVPLFSNFGREPLPIGQVVLLVFRSVLPGILWCLCSFFCMLHAWLNVFAELATFADRLFYQDWWNEYTFAGYIRSWNIIVYDWLHTYVYNDCMRYIVPNNRPLATIAVFGLSSVFHEIILGLSLRFFYPLLSIQFGVIGVLLMYATKCLGRNVGSMVQWFLLLFGFGLDCCLFNMEYYARKNCPNVENDLMDYFVPVSWHCNGIYSSMSNHTAQIP